MPVIGQSPLPPQLAPHCKAFMAFQVSGGVRVCARHFSIELQPGVALSTAYKSGR
jgi:hypothetical protein